ncbi:MAG: hypothetical protein GF401_00400 [Chitinivibrionales bacterium]|nr:hypothetical protein [Chitinivibrionales bacterium]
MIFRFIAGIFFCTTLCFAADRNPGYVINYPDDALIQNGGCVYDITNPPQASLTAAAGDGTTDDLQAFIDAFDHVLQLMDNGRAYNNEDVIKNPDGLYIIYLPDGIYNVTDMITYSGPTRFDEGRVDRNENVVGMKFIGQSRNGTIVRLAPNSTGFGDPQNPKAVFPFARPGVEFNNWACKVHGCRNMTIDVTSNAGAVGIDYWSANSGLIMNVLIKADPGAGAIGLHLRIAVAAGYYQDITIDGFEYGIKSDGSERASHPVFEHITLNNQRTAAFSIAEASTTIRKLTTETTAPAIELVENPAQVILLESELDGGAESNTAIDIKGNGHLFARDIVVGGYGTSVRKAGSDIVTGNISEYTSYDWRITRQSDYSMRVPIEDVPIVPFSESTAQWVKPSGYDEASVQAAMNAGKETVYFPGKTPYAFGTVTVPSTVIRIDGMSHDLDGTLRIDESSSTPLVIMDAKEVIVDNRSSRTVIMLASGQWGEIRNDGTRQKWHLCTVGQMRIENVTNAQVWGRWINAEGVRYLTVNNCQWVQMGYKSERQDMPGVQIRDNSRVELLGGTFGVHNDDTLVFVDNSSSAVILANNSGPYSSTLPAIVDEGSDALFKEDFPNRTSEYWFFMCASHSEAMTGIAGDKTLFLPESKDVDFAPALRITNRRPDLSIYDLQGRRFANEPMNHVDKIRGGLYIITLDGGEYCGKRAVIK